MRIASKQMLTSGIVVAALVSGFASSSEAFWLDAFFCHVEEGAKQNERWPSPYICPDRVYAHAPFNAMITNGWRRQNLLGAHHFNGDSTELTQAGELKVRWILEQAPPAYRRIFVERSFVDETTQARVATTQKFAEEFATGDVPQVAETHIVSEGRPAATVDFVNSKFRENMRVPTLPASTGDNQ